MASAYLSRTPSSTGNRKLFTFSCWFKKYSTGVDAGIFNQYENDNNYFRIRFRSDDRLQIDDKDSGSTIFSLILSRQSRDTSGFYHLVVAYDSAQSTAADRVKIYINGVLETALDTSAYPSQNANAFMNLAGHSVQIARTRPSGPHFLDGLMTHIHLADGTAYAASTFGEFDSNGVWKPKTSPSVTYGTNGFFLKMDNSGNMGLDSSGQSNNLTTSGTITQAKDTPSNVFTTLNPLDTADATDFSSFLSEGNLTLGGSANDMGIRGTLGANSGKFYWEIKANDNGDTLGFATSDVRLQINSTSGSPAAGFWSIQSNGTGNSINICDNGVFTNNNALQGYASNAIIGIALDMDNGKAYCSFNGVFKDRANQTSDPANQTNPFFSSLPTDGTFIMPFTEHRNSGGSTFWNYGNGYFGTTAVTSAGTNASGNGIFEYDVPTGYTALSTKGLNT